MYSGLTRFSSSTFERVPHKWQSVCDSTPSEYSLECCGQSTLARRNAKQETKHLAAIGSDRLQILGGIFRSAVGIKIFALNHDSCVPDVDDASRHSSKAIIPCIAQCSRMLKERCFFWRRPCDPESRNRRDEDCAMMVRIARAYLAYKAISSPSWQKIDQTALPRV